MSFVLIRTLWLQDYSPTHPSNNRRLSSESQQAAMDGKSIVLLSTLRDGNCHIDAIDKVMIDHASRYTVSVFHQLYVLK